MRRSGALTAVKDFANTVGLPMASFDSRTGEWSGTGLMHSLPDEHGQIKVLMRKADGSEWPLGNFSRRIRVDALPLLADMYLQLNAWKADVAEAPVDTAIAEAQAFIQRANTKRSGTCPRCHRRINGEILSCVCPPDDTVNLSSTELIARIVRAHESAETHIRTATSTARLESYERRDLKDAKERIREANLLVENLALSLAEPVAA